MDHNIVSLIQQNSPDGGFLQSEEWKKFQGRAGRNTHSVSSENFNANIIEHNLPVVGKYFYVPRGPVISQPGTVNSEQYIKEIIGLARKENAGWIRIEPNDPQTLELIGKKWQVVKSPHDMQPREIFIIDITKPEEQLLAEMKSKTRYNVKLAKKKGIIVSSGQGTANGKYVNEFLRLVHITSCRNKIVCHSEDYYRKMLETVSGNILKLYVAQYQGKIIAANLVIFYGSVVTYLHGASDDEYRNVMAPYLLQWRQIKDAKMAGCVRYDFGGVKTANVEKGKWNNNTWGGITKFKLGFSPKTKSTEFPGSYDIIINRKRYFLYRIIQKIKSILK